MRLHVLLLTHRVIMNFLNQFPAFTNGRFCISIQMLGVAGKSRRPGSTGLVFPGVSCGWRSVVAAPLDQVPYDFHGPHHSELWLDTQAV